MKIDVHSHFYPARYIDIIGELYPDGSPNIVGLDMPAWETAEARLAEMDRVGVDVEVMSLSAPNVYFDDHRLSLELARLANDELSQVCQDHPDRFKGFASLPLGDATTAVEELRRAMRLPGMVGVILGTNFLGETLDNPRLEPIYAEMNELEVPVFIHPMAPVGLRSIQEYKLAPLVGFLFETTITVTRMIFGGVFERYPNVKLILPHMGGTLPFIFNRIDLGFKSYPECRANSSKLPSEFLKTFYFDTALAYNRSAVMCAYDLVGPEHIVFGTDYPFAKNLMPRAIASIENLDLAHHDKECIFSENAKLALRRLAGA